VVQAGPEVGTIARGRFDIAADDDLLVGLLTPDSGEFRRTVGIGGFTFRPNQKIVVSGDVEAASGDRTYFRTSLNDYQKMHARARYQALQTLSLSADFSLLNNQNPAPA